jgi:VWFA-related protein
MKIFGLLVFVPILALAGAAQNPVKPADDQGTFRVNVDLVNVPFTVSDRHGKLVTTLKEEDFKVFEDEKPQSITHFDSESNLPLAIGLLIDTSGSIRDELQFEEEAASTFFYQTLRRGKDKGCIISFDSAPEIIHDFTDNPEELANSVHSIRAGGGTALYDAVWVAIKERLSKENGRRVLILITDGDDNSSRMSLTETMELAQKENVTIYAISTNTQAANVRSGQDRGDKTLRRLADDTGGKAFFPSKPQDLTTDFQGIGDELRHQYFIGYRSTNLKSDGVFRKIRIVVDNKSYKVNARSGYYAPRSSR